MKSPITCSIAFSLATLCTLSTAQSAEKDKASERQAWVLMASASGELAKTSRVFSGGTSVEILDSKRSIGAAIKIAADGVIVVAKPNKDSTAGTPLATISVPANMQQALIVLIPNVDADGAMTIESKLCDLSSFKPGNWLFLNLTKSTIRVTEDGKPLEIAPGADALTRGSPSTQTKSVSLSYDYKKNDADPWSAISSSSTVRSPNRREICIFTEDPELETIDYHALQFTGR